MIKCLRCTLRIKETASLRSAANSPIGTKIAADLRFAFSYNLSSPYPFTCPNPTIINFEVPIEKSDWALQNFNGIQSQQD